MPSSSSPPTCAATAESQLERINRNGARRSRARSYTVSGPSSRRRAGEQRVLAAERRRARRHARSTRRPGRRACASAVARPLPSMNGLRLSPAIWRDLGRARRRRPGPMTTTTFAGAAADGHAGHATRRAADGTTRTGVRRSDGSNAHGTAWSRPGRDRAPADPRRCRTPAGPSSTRSSRAPASSQAVQSRAGAGGRGQPAQHEAGQLDLPHGRRERTRPRTGVPGARSR